MPGPLVVRGRMWVMLLVLSCFLCATSARPESSQAPESAPPFAQAQEAAGAGLFGRACGTLEKSKEKEGETWTPDQRQQVDLALAAMWLRMNPLDRKAMGQRLKALIEETSPGSDVKAVVSLTQFLGGDALAGANTLSEIHLSWVMAGKPDAGRSLAEAAQLVRGVLLTLTGLPMYADEGMKSLEAMGADPATSPDARKMSLYAGGFAAGMWKHWERMRRLTGELDRIEKDYQPTVESLSEVLATLTQDKVDLQAVPALWNPLGPAMEAYVMPFMTAMKASTTMESCQALCLAIVDRLGREGQLQMGLYHMAKGQYSQAMPCLQAYLMKEPDAETKRRMLAYCASCGVWMATKDSLAVTGMAMVEALELDKAGGAADIFKSLVSSSYGEAVSKTDQMIAGLEGSGTPEGSKKAQQMKLARALMRRWGMAGLSDYPGAYADLKAVIDATPAEDATHQLALYVASEMASNIEPASTWRKELRSLGKPGEDFRVEEALVEAVDGVLDGPVKFGDYPEWREFLGTIVTFTKEELRRRPDPT